MKKLILTIALISGTLAASAQTSKTIIHPNKKEAQAARYHLNDTVVVKYGKRLETYILTGNGYTNKSRQIFYDCKDLNGKLWYRLPERAILAGYLAIK